MSGSAPRGASSWLSTTPAGSLAAALTDHFGRDLDRLRELASAEPRAAMLAEYAAAMGPRVFRTLPGCAGTHVLGSAHAPADADLDLVVAEAAALAGESYSAKLPTARSLTLTSYGCTVSYDGDGDGAVVEVADGRLTVRWDAGTLELDRAPSRLTVVASPTVSVEVWQRPSVLPLAAAGPGAPLVPSSVRVTPLAGDAARAFDRAVALLRRVWPELYEEMVAAGTHVVPIAPVGDGGIASFSERRLPFLVFLNSAGGNPIDIADQLVHEFHHSALFLLEEDEPLLGDAFAPSVSPWRAELRTAGGLVHGVYVFLHVAELYDRIWREFPPTRAALRRSYALRASIAAGVELLAGAGCAPTAAGASLIGEVAAANNVAVAAARAADADLWAEAEAAVAEHLAQAGTPDSTAPSYLAFL